MSREVQAGTSSSRKMRGWMFGLGFAAAGAGVMVSGLRHDDPIQAGMGGILAGLALVATLLLYFKR